MKKLIQATAVLMSLVSFMGSCSKSNTAPASATTSNPAKIITTGTWAVSSLNQRGEDKTAQFNGYVFTFSSEGIIKAEKNGAFITGAWLYSPSAVIYYGSTGTNASMNIGLGGDKPLSQLSKVWNIDSTATSASKLSLVSPEVAEAMRLEFSKR